jgi:anti-sigma factor RsiW
MMTEDPFVHFDGAYVLGALDDADRRAFEAHLATCSDCRARVDEARSTAALLAVLPAHDMPGLFDEPAPMPDTLLPGVLRRAAQERTRRWRLTAAVGAVAAALLVALAIVVWPGSKTDSTPPAQALSAVQPSPLTATARLVTKSWGTEIELHCAYPASDSDRFSYNLLVIDKNRHTHDAGDWTLVPGKDGISFTGGTAVQRDQIARVQITTPSGVPILELKL